MKRGIFIVLLVVVLCSALTLAEEGISISEINASKQVEPGQTAVFNLLLTNDGSKEYTVQIQGDPYVGLPSSDFDYLFINPTIITLSGYEQKEITISTKLKSTALRQKRYKTYVTATALNHDGVSTTFDLEVFAMPPQSAITISLPSPETKVGPGGIFALKMTLKNNLQDNLHNIDVHVTSDLFNDQQTIELFKGQSKDLEFYLPISKDAAPKSYSYNVRIYFDKELQGSNQGTITIDENLNVSQHTEISSGFLYTERKTTFINNGNVEVSDSYFEEPSTVASWFTSYSLDPNYDDELGRPTWSFTISPSQSITITSKEDYRPLLFGIIALLLLGIIAYYLFIKRVTVRKEVFKLKYSVDGVSDFKVLLHVKNSTSKPIKDVTIIDVLPKLIQPKTNFGTLHPSGIERGDKGIRMMWKIPELVNGEERVISYEVEAQFKIIGEITLPNATVKYKNKSGRIIHVRSNSVNFLSGIAETVKKRFRKKQKE